MVRRENLEYASFQPKPYSFLVGFVTWRRGTDTLRPVKVVDPEVFGGEKKLKEAIQEAFRVLQP